MSGLPSAVLINLHDTTDAIIEIPEVVVQLTGWRAEQPCTCMYDYLQVWKTVARATFSTPTALAKINTVKSVRDRIRKK